jgi:hypothetical protein
VVSKFVTFAEEGCLILAQKSESILSICFMYLSAYSSSIALFLAALCTIYMAYSFAFG